MEWLERWDVAGFRWINQELSDRVLDFLMRLISDLRVLSVLLACVVAWVWWRRGRLGLVMGVVLLIGLLVSETVGGRLKKWIARPRPFVDQTSAIMRVGQGSPYGSMPSGHAMNWGLIAVITGCYSRRSFWVTGPVAGMVAFSRVYSGVHYPSDVLVGLTLGAFLGALVVWAAERSRLGLGTRFGSPRAPDVAPVPQPPEGSSANRPPREDSV